MAGERKNSVLSSWLEKPPVAVVDIEYVKLSNTPMPAAIYDRIHPTVSARYIDHIHLAFVLSRGCILERMGPVASAANTLTLPPTIDGSMAIVKNTIPNPPINCVRERQKRMP